jgi:hypothetical protein
MMTLLAQAAADADPMISGKWLIAAAVAIIGAVGGVLLKRWGLEQGRSERHVTIADQPISFSQASPAATQTDLDAHIERVDKQISDIWVAIQAERGVARTALSRIHERLDLQSKVTATLQGSVEEVGKNVGRLLDLALNRKPPTR